MSSRFEPQAWQLPGQSTWDQPQSSSGTLCYGLTRGLGSLAKAQLEAGSPMHRPDDLAFETQIEGVSRACVYAMS